MDPRHAILFEPVKIGPVTAPNRFYQVPHCTGMGHVLPQTLAAMRGMKAEGGWGVVCTEYCSIHPSSDDHPYPFASLWDEGDVANNAAMVEAVKRHGALAGVELWHGGSRVSNLASRAPTLGPSSRRAHNDPIQSARMDLADIRALLTWQKDAAKRAVRAGFDIVYVYATHQYLLWQFLSHSHNDRSDDYGGNLKNRSRLVRELLEVTREAVGDKAAVAIRFSANGHGDDHLTKDDARLLMGEWNPLVDLWDLVVDDYSGWEMAPSRFRQEGSLDEEIAGLRQSLGKPILTVGRFTSPDLMASRIKRGLVDFIGAARPSIADPFLPSKIRQGRAEDIRECIGCNICYAHDGRGSAFRCTQNPTLGEEWRQGWHPEKVPMGKSESVLIVGAGPAGLEAALTLGRRGYNVTLADAGQQAGGRVTAESRLPGLAEWARVRDHRLHQIGKMNNVTLHLGSTMTASDVKDFGAEHVLIATGATWRRDALGRHQQRPLSGLQGLVLTPDDIFAGKLPQGAVVIYDDDGYYLGSVLALKLVASGAKATLVTPDSTVCAWGAYTAEQGANHQALLKAGVKIKLNLALSGFDGKSVKLSSTYDEVPETLAADALLLVTLRDPNDALYRTLAEDPGFKPKTLRAIGDCYQPALIFHAVYSGHRAARELGGAAGEIRRDRLQL